MRLNESPFLRLSANFLLSLSLSPPSFLVASLFTPPIGTPYAAGSNKRLTSHSIKLWPAKSNCSLFSSRLRPHHLSGIRVRRKNLPHRLGKPGKLCSGINSLEELFND